MQRMILIHGFKKLSNAMRRVAFLFFSMYRKLNSIEALDKESKSLLNKNEIFKNKIINRIPFAIIRPSGGEYHILQNKTITNCDDEKKPTDFYLDLISTVLKQ